MRVLILAYDFPPFPSVGGGRPFAWYRYLREFGVDPVVVTRQWTIAHGDERDYVGPGESQETLVDDTPQGRIIRTPYTPNLSNRLLLKYGESRFRLPRRSLTAFYEVGQYFLNLGPKRRIYLAARDYLSREGADAIIATGEPFVLFRYASELSREFGIPWLADYRDAWTQDQRRRRGLLPARWDAFLEQRFTADAAALSTVSEFLVTQLLADTRRKPVHVLPNGYDPEAIGDAPTLPQSRDRLTIGFTGSIYKWHPLESVLRVCAEFASSSGAELALRFAGIGDRHVVEARIAQHYPALARHATFLPKMANDQLARELAPANLLLLFNNYSYAGTKIYDYLALRRRILLCYTADADALRLKAAHYNLPEDASLNTHVLQDILEETRSGVEVKDPEHLSRVLTESNAELQATGSLRCDSVGVERYSRRHGVRLLAQVVRAMVAQQGPAGRPVIAHRSSADRKGEPWPTP